MKNKQQQNFWPSHLNECTELLCGLNRIIKDTQVIIFKNIVIFCLKIFFIFANSVEPDEMQHFAAFHLGLHCLQKYSFRGIQRVNIKPVGIMNKHHCLNFFRQFFRD